MYSKNINNYVRNNRYPRAFNYVQVFTYYNILNISLNIYLSCSKYNIMHIHKISVS